MRRLPLVGQATDRCQEAAQAVRADLEASYRQACVRYVLAAAAADGDEPVAALKVDQDAVDAAAARWPLPPDTSPVTGLLEVDTAIEQARLDAGGRKPGKRRRRAAPASGGDRQLLDEGKRLTGYAGTITAFVEGGQLTPAAAARPRRARGVTR